VGKQNWTKLLINLRVCVDDKRFRLSWAQYHNSCAVSTSSFRRKTDVAAANSTRWCECQWIVDGWVRFNVSPYTIGPKGDEFNGPNDPTNHRRSQGVHVQPRLSGEMFWAKFTRESCKCTPSRVFTPNPQRQSKKCNFL